MKFPTEAELGAEILRMVRQFDHEHPVRAKPKRVTQPRGEHPLVKVFSVVTGLTVPKVPQEMSGAEWTRRWEAPLRAILSQAGGDQERARGAIVRAVQAMRNHKPDPLTIDAPGSILKVTRDVLARSAPDERSRETYGRF